MKSLMGKKLADSVSSAGSMILFLLFASCSLIMIAAAASTYARISAGFGKTFNSSSAARYITNKIRSGESSSVEMDGRAISVDLGDTVCLIVNSDKGITEITRRSQDTTGGSEDLIFPGTKMYVSSTETDGLYNLTVFSGDEIVTVLCRSKG